MLKQLNYFSYYSQSTYCIFLVSIVKVALSNLKITIVEEDVKYLMKYKTNLCIPLEFLSLKIKCS